MLHWLNETGVIHCPSCDRVAKYTSAQCNSDYTIVSGTASCQYCVTRSPSILPSIVELTNNIRHYLSPRLIPLTFDFLYDILLGSLRTVGNGCQQRYLVERNFGRPFNGRTNGPENTIPENTIPENTIPENTIPENTIPENTIPENTIPEKTIMNVYVIRRRDARNLIVDIITTEQQAERWYGDCLNLEILPYTCDHPSIGGVGVLCFKVWVVTVGKGDSTRIVGVFPDKKEAAKVASPIQGRLRELEAVPYKRQLKSIAVYKSFVSMQDGTSEYHRAQVIDRVSVRRKLYEGEENILFPVATFRRRYNSSLPHRIEILAISERTAKTIAMQFGEMDDDEICEMLEYNVGYQLLLEDNEWRFDPCLLNQPV